MGDPTFHVNTVRGEDGRLYVELAGLKAWMRERLAVRTRIREQRLGEGGTDPGPLSVPSLLAALEKVDDGTRTRAV